MKLMMKQVLLLAAIGSIAWADDKPGIQSSTGKGEKPAVAAPETKPKSTLPIVGYLETRGKTIIIKSGPKGPVYSVKSPQGKVLFENLSKDQLRAKSPELHEFLKTAVAGGKGAGKDKAGLDASVRTPMR